MNTTRNGDWVEQKDKREWWSLVYFLKEEDNNPWFKSDLRICLFAWRKAWTYQRCNHSCKSEDKQNQDQKKRNKKIEKDDLKKKHYTEHYRLRSKNRIKYRGELECPGSVISSCFAGGIPSCYSWQRVGEKSCMREGW